MARVAQTERFENELTPMSGAYKQSGILVIVVFQKLFALAFSGRTLFMSLKTASFEIGKGTFYRFVNSSWFASPKTIMAVTDENLDVIAMLKKTSKVHYRYEGEMLPVTEICKRNRKRRGRSKYLLSVYVELCQRDACKSVPAKLVFVRNRNKRKDYLILVSTDVSLSEEEIIRLYGKRWNIEVFFKVCKSYLNLTGECRSLSYDAMTAYAAIVFSRYIMLAAENRIQMDDRTFGELFYDACES